MSLSGRSEHLDIVLGGHSEGVKTLLGRFKRGRFVKAPLIASSLHCLNFLLKLTFYR
jgi:hypothetical protein